MKTRAHLDIFALRSLVAAHQLGGFHRAAGHVGRSQSAISQQIQKLEREVGHPLFEKRGRGVALTETGELVLGYARRILELNDELVEAVSDRAVAGSVRLGLPADFSEDVAADRFGALSPRPSGHPDRSGRRPQSPADRTSGPG